MNIPRKSVFLLAGMSLLIALVIGSAALAASSATITFLDTSDQPLFLVTSTGLVDDFPPCDRVTMLMTDATGSITDFYTFCVHSTSGVGYGDTIWGTYGGYYPVLGPITYTLFDTAPGDICNTTVPSAACADYLRSCAVPSIAEAFYQPASLPAGTPYSLACSAPAPDASGCKLAIPPGSVVGDLPFKTQLYWSPGNASPGHFVNPGTYVVVGQDQTETYYKIVLACQFVWVPKANMQPSYLPPQNGAPLPTRIVS